MSRELVEALTNAPAGFVARYLLAGVEQGDRTALALLYGYRHDALRGDAFSQDVIEEAKYQIRHDILNGQKPIANGNIVIGIEPMTIAAAAAIGVWLWGLLGVFGDWIDDASTTNLEEKVSETWSFAADLVRRLNANEQEARAQYNAIITDAQSGEPEAIMLREIIRYLRAAPDIAPYLGSYVAQLMFAAIEPPSDSVLETRANIREAIRTSEIARERFAIAQTFIDQMEEKLVQVTRIDDIRPDPIDGGNGSDTGRPVPQPLPDDSVLTDADRVYWQNVCTALKSEATSQADRANFLALLWGVIDTTRGVDNPAFRAWSATNAMTMAEKQAYCFEVVLYLVSTGCIPSPGSLETLIAVIRDATDLEDVLNKIEKATEPDPRKKPPKQSSKDKAPTKTRRPKPTEDPDVKESAPDKPCGCAPVKMVCYPIQESAPYGRVALPGSRRRSRTHGDVKIGGSGLFTTFRKGWRR